MSDQYEPEDDYEDYESLSEYDKENQSYGDMSDEDYCAEFPEECDDEENYDPLDMYDPDFDPDSTDEDW